MAKTTAQVIVDRAIERSITHNEIVTIAEGDVQLADKVCRELERRCDDSVETGGETEFWGVDDGDSWRVHLVDVPDIARAVAALEAEGYTVHETATGGHYLVGMAPDSGGGSTEPGSAWDEECDDILDTIQKLVEPFRVDAVWVDNDIALSR